MESGELVVFVMGACIAGCVCAICAIEYACAFISTQRTEPLLDALSVQ